MPLQPETVHTLKLLTSHIAAVLLAAGLVCAVLLRTPLAVDILGMSLSVNDCDPVEASEALIDGEPVDPDRLCIFGDVEAIEGSSVIEAP